MIGGVCSGIADYLEIDTPIIRIVWLLLVLGAGVGILAYIVAWICIPEYDEWEDGEQDVS